jgi:hypothetical protein
MSSFLLGGIIGLLLGLAWCYWKQIQFAYQNQGLISSGSNLITDLQNFWANVQKV